MIEVFKTNISNYLAADNVKRHLMKAANCSRVTIDLQDCDLVLKVVSEQVLVPQIIREVNNIGFECYRLEG